MENVDEPKKNKPMLEFLDRYLNVSEAKVTYLTRVTPIDRVLAKTFLPLLPKRVTPNQITKFRLISIPFVLYFFIAHYFLAGTILFLFSAFSDALDGALARTTNQITSWGTLYDPVADKLLVGLTSLVIVSQYLGWNLALIICFIEILLISSAYFRYKGRVTPAKTIAKMKMILQCVGIIFLLFFILLGAPWLLITARIILYLSVIFALLTLFVFRSI